ncbi:MAG: hypothetical protein KDE54_33170, partial [Caldilineaceae bacterium]|nr:hypothetical protein [Caldilineaceae bacterium]
MRKLLKTLNSTKFPMLLALLVIAALLLAACGAEDEPAPVQVTPQPAPTATDTAVPVPTFTPTDTPLPTETPEPQVSASSEITAETSAETTVEGIKDAEGHCLIETNLDLAGYPNLHEQMGCALDLASFDDVAINEFGEGPDYDRFMFWFSSNHEILVLLPNQTWEAFPDTWTEDQPELTCTLDGVPATSPPLPRRGFGKLWCTVGELQQIMGTIPREERLCQHAVVQPFEQGRLLACFEDATVRYIR